MCLSDVEVIGQSMAMTQLLPVSENKGGSHNFKVGHVTLSLDIV